MWGWPGMAGDPQRTLCEGSEARSDCAPRFFRLYLAFSILTENKITKTKKLLCIETFA